MAQGYKRLATQRDQLLLLLEAAQSRRETLYRETCKALSKALKANSDMALRIQDMAEKLAQSRRQAGLAKGQVLKGEEVCFGVLVTHCQVVARATLAEVG